MSSISFNIHGTRAYTLPLAFSHAETEEYVKMSHNTLRHHKNSSDFIVTQCDTFTVYAPYMARKSSPEPLMSLHKKFTLI